MREQHHSPRILWNGDCLRVSRYTRSAPELDWLCYSWSPGAALSLKQRLPPSILSVHCSQDSGLRACGCACRYLSLSWYSISREVCMDKSTIRHVDVSCGAGAKQLRMACTAALLPLRMTHLC